MKYKKADLLFTIDLLEQANRDICKRAIQKTESVENTLIECQNAAIEIGTYLESLGTAMRPIVKLLEDYCENVYQQSIHFQDVSLGTQVSENIRSQLREIRRSIQCEPILDRKEVAFLPYKASMWDSLESVWAAAQKDSSWDVHVVPIPYYEKNTDGSLGEMIYEGNEYPQYIPIVDWQEYNLEERRPDIIFIHNPYDDSNYVSSVHPCFYAAKLKKYTKMLVYIPYFVGMEGNVAEHFCLAPGVLYADRVIVESENVKKIYVRAIEKAESESHCKGVFGNLKKKILALGSPKLDKVNSLNPADAEVPVEWEQMINGTDGKRKKVIFYNTTVQALLDHGSAVLEKIEKVIDWFGKEEDAILLWRPHPLAISALKSMRPQIYHKYISIVKQYQSEGRGIYDDSTDLQRAVSISDAYYGDRSSVAELYKETGKPILIQAYEDV